jgi:hypothetical protein
LVHLGSLSLGEIISDLKDGGWRKRIPGARIKHRVKENWLKRHDKERIVRMSWKFPLVYGNGLLWNSYRTDYGTSKESLNPKDASSNQEMTGKEIEMPRLRPGCCDLRQLESARNRLIEEELGISIRFCG